MNAIFNFLSSPLKQPAERPPPSSMPLTASRPNLSPREQRLAKRAADRFSEPEGRSPRTRLSNVSLASSDHDNTAEISIISRRRETITMPPPSTKKRISTSTRSSPIYKQKTSASVSRVASSPAIRSSPRRRTSVELGSSPPTSYTRSPAATPKSVTNGVAQRSETKSPRRSSRASRVAEPQTNGKPHKEKTPEVEQPEEQPEEQPKEEQYQEESAQDDEDKLYEFESIANYRWVKDKIELRIQWTDGDNTWIPEEVLHEDNPQALFAFWRSKPHGRPNNPAQGDIYQVFAVRKHRVRKGNPEVLVEWVGYESSENTWESQEYIKEVAPQILDAYFEKAKGKRQVKSKPKAKAKPKAPAKTRAPAKTSTRTGTRSSGRITKR
ncbi:chromo domain protein [Fusarium beomiforme]|uniref:Chromo domain protein n=1 Tax=Fusarium beomiforme TaxID=44412 RepID=A0A9P5E073_9HYPO|nr:chromo domain protein [Fusarium beomiforme]